MAKQDKLITYAYMKEECDLPPLLDQLEMEGKIYRAQEMLRGIMCDDFYQDFLTNYKNNTLSETYTTLFPYVKQFVAWQAHAYWIVQANFKFTRGGIRVHTEQNSTVATDEQMGDLIKDAKYQAEYYKGLLKGYLDRNKTSFPLYCDCTCKDSSNVFAITAVKNKVYAPQPYGTVFKRCRHD